MPEETWSPRDLPLLAAFVDLIDKGATSVRPDDLIDYTGFDAENVRRGMVALAHEDPPFFEYSNNASLVGDVLDSFRNPTGHARRTVGTWPTAENLADRIIAGLNEAAENSDDEEEASRLRRTGQWMGNAGRDVMVNVIAGMLGGG